VAAPPLTYSLQLVGVSMLNPWGRGETTSCKIIITYFWEMWE